MFYFRVLGPAGPTIRLRLLISLFDQLYLFKLFITLRLLFPLFFF